MGEEKDNTLEVKNRPTEPLIVNVALSNENRLFASCSNRGEGCTYCFALCEGEEVISKLFFSPDLTAVFWPTKGGTYRVKVIVAHEDESREVAYSSPIVFEGVTISIEKPAKRETFIHSLVCVIQELWANRDRMVRLAVYDYRVRNTDSYLGKLWSVLNPLIQVLTYWFVFGLGMRGGKAVDGHPYLLWMLSGLLPWFYVNAGIIGGCSSVYTKAGMVLRMQYPLATIPVGNIITNFIDHIITMVILLVVLLCYGYMPRLVWLNIIYYWIYGTVFLSALALVTSTLTMIARDFQKLIVSLMRLLFYLTPVLWTVDSMPEISRDILRLNPLLYIVNGYRDSLLYGVNFWEHYRQAPFFWVVALAVLLLGCHMHRKYRDSYIDML